MFNKNKEEKKKPESTLGKIWYFLWEDNSVASWIVNIVLAFVLIRFVVYPGLGLIFGTGFPIVAVVSNSMQHQGTFDEWWHQGATCSDGEECLQWEWYLEKNITKEDFQTYRFENGFNKGDIIVLRGKPPEEIKVGDVLVYNAGNKYSYPIIHRIVSKWDENGATFFMTKGDNNEKPINSFGLNENRIGSSQAIGVAMVKIPWLGYVKIWAVDLLRILGFYSTPSGMVAVQE